jgi:ABC-type uncharacterized transport system YnjBCD ATPase subunit
VLENLLFALPPACAPTRIARAEAALAARPAGPRPALAAQPVGRPALRGCRCCARCWRSREAVLLDEPFSRLDAALRQRFRAFVFDRIARSGIPAVLVTHDRRTCRRARRDRACRRRAMLDRCRARLLRPGARCGGARPAPARLGMPIR